MTEASNDLLKFRKQENQAFAAGDRQQLVEALVAQAGVIEDPAEKAGIKAKDIILEVNQSPVESVKEVKQHLAESDDDKSLLLLVHRNQRSFFVGLTG